MGTPHKWSKEIKAWADGAEIQVRAIIAGRYNPQWMDLGVGEQPDWREGCDYRIKPEPKDDNIVNVLVEFKNVWKSPYIRVSWNGNHCPAGYLHNLDLNLTHIRFIFDGETEELKTVELLK